MEVSKRKSKTQNRQKSEGNRTNLVLVLVTAMDLAVEVVKNLERESTFLREWGAVDRLAGCFASSYQSKLVLLGSVVPQQQPCHTSKTSSFFFFSRRDLSAYEFRQPNQSPKNRARATSIAIKLPKTKTFKTGSVQQQDELRATFFDFPSHCAGSVSFGDFCSIVERRSRNSLSASATCACSLPTCSSCERTLDFTDSASASLDLSASTIIGTNAVYSTVSQLQQRKKVSASFFFFFFFFFFVCEPIGSFCNSRRNRLFNFLRN